MSNYYSVEIVERDEKGRETSRHAITQTWETGDYSEALGSIIGQAIQSASFVDDPYPTAVIASAILSMPDLPIAMKAVAEAYDEWDGNTEDFDRIVTVLVNDKLTACGKRVLHYPTQVTSRQHNAMMLLRKTMQNRATPTDTP